MRYASVCVDPLHPRRHESGWNVCSVTGIQCQDAHHRFSTTCAPVHPGYRWKQHARMCTVEGNRYSHHRRTSTQSDAVHKRRSCRQVGRFQQRTNAVIHLTNAWYNRRRFPQFRGDTRGAGSVRSDARRIAAVWVCYCSTGGCFVSLYDGFCYTNMVYYSYIETWKSEGAWVSFHAIRMG